MALQRLISVILLFLAFGDALPQNEPHPRLDNLHKRQSLFGVIRPDPPGAAPRFQKLKTDSPIPGVQRIKVRSGPYMAPNMQKMVAPTGEPGILWNYPHRNIQKPCNECVILKQWAGLEYPDGSVANVNNGLWLHHMVHFVEGPTRWDPVCYKTGSLPHVDVLLSVTKAERSYFCGNERTPFDHNPKGRDLSQGTGFQITSADKFHYLVDLMNMHMEDKLVYLTMTYDILEGQLPPGWNDTKAFWLDAASCLTSEVWPRKQSGSFTIESPTWKPNFEGKLLWSVGHLHDGGTSTVTMVSPTKPLCESDARYGEEPGFHNNETIRAKMGREKTASSHISSMTECKLGVPQLKKDQSWKVIGKYDYDRHDGNTHAGKQSEIMAISVMLVEVPRGGVPRP